MRALLRGLGSLCRICRGDGGDDRGAAAADGLRGARPVETQAVRPDLLRGGRGGHDAHAARGVRPAAPLPLRTGIRLGGPLRRRGAAPHPAGGAARGPRRPVQPAVLHRGGDEKGLDRTGRRLFRRRSRDGLERPDRLLAAGGAAGCGAGGARDEVLALPRRGRRGEPLRRRSRRAAGGVERPVSVAGRPHGREGAPQPAVLPVAQRRGALPERPLGPAPAGRRPRRHGRRRHEFHAPHRPLRRDAPPAGGRTVGIPVRRGGLPARGLPLRGRRRGGGVHALLRGPRRRAGAAPLLRPADDARGEARTHRPLAAAGPDEFAALLAPGTGAPDIRSVFRIDTGTGVVRALLDTVEEYDPEAASVRCTFTRLTEDAL